MTIQAKGWLPNVVRVLYTVHKQKTLMTGMSLLIVILWTSSLFGVVSQTTRLFQNTDGDFSSTRVFPDVSFDSKSQARKTNQKSFLFLHIEMLIWSYPETFVNKGTGWCELTWSLLDTYLRHLEKLFQRKTKKEYLETRNNGLMLYAQSILPPKLM